MIDVTVTSEAYVTLEALLKDAERDAIVVSPAVARALERRFTLVPISPAGGRTGLPARRASSSPAWRRAAA